MAEPTLKSRTAGTLKWNLIDRLASQVLYAVTGIVLARLLSTEDFGLVGAVLVFQAFASVLVDSGFAYALLQRKSPTQTDYSTVLWFNLAVSGFLYVVLFLCADAIASLFGDGRLVALSRVMFLSLILNASSIVQVNRLMKKMDVKMVAISNTVGLVAAGITGIWFAVSGYGAWAIVWQTLTLATVKSALLWITQRWLPSAEFSFKALKSFFGLGSRMMMTSFLNTVFLNIYSIFIGNRAGLGALGYYSQADKWSKMGIMSLSQVLTSSFLPTLSAVQDDRERFLRACAKMNRFTAYFLFPAMLGLMVMATPLFHVLFGEKWDPSIILFQLLLLRGVFTVLTGLYNNFLLSQAHARTIMWMEVLRDGVALGALFITLPYLACERPGNVVWGLEVLLWGQLAASVVAWAVTLMCTSRLLDVPVWRFITQLLPYLSLTFVAVIVMHFAAHVIDNDFVALTAQILLALAIYIGGNRLAGSQIQKDVLGQLRPGRAKA